jgi:uncharacterized protein (UPF0332 family)
MLRPSPPERYEEISQRLLVQGEEELDRNDVLQASEKVWGATAHAIKAVSQARGWNHRYHNHLREAVGYIATERGDKRLRSRFALLNDLHENYYEHQIYKDEVQEAINEAKVFSQLMQDARLSGSPSDQSHLSPDEAAAQARRLNILTRRIKYPHGAEFTEDELDALPPV